MKCPHCTVEIFPNADTSHILYTMCAENVLQTSPGERCRSFGTEGQDVAEWCLEILEGLFDHFYVGPALAAKKKAALDAKLAAAGKPASK